MNSFKDFYGRVMAIIVKEFLELRRDKISLLMIFAIPIINQFVLGFSVNTDPKFVKTALIDYDNSVFSRTLIKGMENTDYFDFRTTSSEKEAELLFKDGKVQFIIIIPAGFARELVAEKKPQLLVQYDATDPTATANATNALMTLVNTVFSNDIKNIANLQGYNSSLIEPVLHKMYNPEGITKFNVVPGLTGVILSIILILMTSLSIIREREKGSIIHIMNSPVCHYEMMLGKMLPYFLVGIIQAILIITGTVYLMEIPIVGSLLSLFLLIFVFIVLCVTIGVIFSAVTNSQLQTMQLASFYFLLSTILSGFMVPFYGMPLWSQILGSFLPLTYFLRLARGIMIKGYSLYDMAPDFISLIVLTFFTAILSYFLFKKVVKD